jgi:hypothetical protein
MTLPPFGLVGFEDQHLSNSNFSTPIAADSSEGVHNQLGVRRIVK